MSREDRLAFYRDKYGENFGGAPGDSRQAGRRERPENRDRRPGKPDKPWRDRQKPQAQNNPPERKEQNQNTGKEQNQAEKKPGLINRIFGFFKKKKESPPRRVIVKNAYRHYRRRARGAYGGRPACRGISSNGF
jgi:hypothetical protein